MLLSLDLETYGACERNAYGETLPRQTVFNPRRSLLIDKVPLKDLILTCSITPCLEDFPCVDTSQNCTADLPTLKEGLLTTPRCNKSMLELLASMQVQPTLVLLLWKTTHKQLLKRWLKQASGLIGMNTMFDVMYLRANPEFRYLLNGNKFLIDLSILNREECDLRPEKSLKTIGPTISLYNYNEPIDLRKGERYPSPLWKDPKTGRGLIEYNAADTHNSMLLGCELARRIIAQYADTKMTNEAFQYYNDTIWSCIRMAETGIPMHRPQLRDLQTHLDRRSKRAARVLREKYKRPVEGVGSDKSKRSFIEHMLNQVDDTINVHHMLGIDTIYEHDLCKRTKKTKKLSYGAENRVLGEVLLTQGKRLDPNTPVVEQGLFPDVPKDVLDLRAMKLWAKQQRAHKVAGTYTAPLLDGRRTKTTKNPLDSILLPQRRSDTTRLAAVQIAHPSIYIVPSSIKDTSNEEGGQRQARLAFKNPAAQTFPAEVKKLLASRHRGGTIRAYDLGQIELRVPAILSGDPVMLDWFKNGIDPHTQRSVQVFGDTVIDNKHFGAGDIRYDPRQWCKRFNFEDLYLAGAKKMQSMMLTESHKLLPIDFFKEQVRLRAEIRPGLTQWQNRQIAYVHKYGRTELLPITGQHRTFMYHADLKPNEIVNFPIQATAANVMLYAQHYVHHKLPKLNHRDPPIKLFLNWYDALWFDVAPGHEEECDALMAETVEHLRMRGYWHRLEEIYDRHVPLVYETVVDGKKVA